MKNLITAIACTMVLLALTVQFAQNQLIYSRITAVNQAADNFREEIRAEGGITEKNERELKSKMADILDCEAEEIKVEGDRSRATRGQLIRYFIEVPISDIVSLHEFWGIEAEENKAGYKIDRVTVSEYAGESL